MQLYSRLPAPHFELTSSSFARLERLAKPSKSRFLASSAVVGLALAAILELSIHVATASAKFTAILISQEAFHDVQAHWTRAGTLAMAILLLGGGIANPKRAVDVFRQYALIQTSFFKLHAFVGVLGASALVAAALAFKRRFSVPTLSIPLWVPLAGIMNLAFVLEAKPWQRLRTATENSVTTGPVIPRGPTRVVATDCVICLEDVNVPSSITTVANPREHIGSSRNIVVLANCGHTYHDRCLRQALAALQEQNSALRCAVCREPIEVTLLPDALPIPLLDRIRESYETAHGIAPQLLVQAREVLAEPMWAVYMGSVFTLGGLGAYQSIDLPFGRVIASVITSANLALGSLGCYVGYQMCSRPLKATNIASILVAAYTFSDFDVKNSASTLSKLLLFAIPPIVCIWGERFGQYRIMRHAVGGTAAVLELSRSVRTTVNSLQQDVRPPNR